LIYYSLDQSPLWIDYVSYCNRTKSPFADWSNDNYNRENKKSAPTNIKEALEYIKGGYNHPVGEVGPASEETLHTCQSNINKEASASLRAQFVRQVLDLQLEKEREWRISGRGLFVLV
jgi:hypothetical protein